jgi:hypothetical protein
MKGSFMTELLKKAFDVAAELSEDEQNKVAEWLLNELATDRQWEKQFSATGQTLARLAREALREHERGQTKILDPKVL